MGRKSDTFPGRVLDVLSSYVISCTLLAFLFLLTLFGTLEQIEYGLYLTQKKYFESFFLVHYLGPVPLPLPGGITCMGLLAVNLFCGGLVRIRKSKSTIGVMVVHVGIALMLAAALVKMSGSDDGHVTLYPGQQSDEFQDWHKWEVAIWDASEVVNVTEYTIPNGDITDLVGGRSRTFACEELGFELELSNFVRNCKALPKGPMWQAAGPTVDGYALKAERRQLKNEQNVAGLHLAVREGGEQTAEGILWAFENYPFVFQSGGQSWAVSLRHTRYKMPFSLRLEEFVKEDHPGMMMAKAYMSDVTKIEDGREQLLRIQMNEPLRHDGLVLFQSGWGPQRNGRPLPDYDGPLYSDFAVVRNPSDYWPLYSCIIIGIGLLLVFGQKLFRYTRSQARARLGTGEV